MLVVGEGGEGLNGDDLAVADVKLPLGDSAVFDHGLNGTVEHIPCRFLRTTAEGAQFGQILQIDLDLRGDGDRHRRRFNCVRRARHWG